MSKGFEGVKTGDLVYCPMRYGKPQRGTVSRVKTSKRTRYTSARINWEYGPATDEDVRKFVTDHAPRTPDELLVIYRATR